MYLGCGCVRVGEIPGYALFPDGVLVATSVVVTLFVAAAMARGMWLH